MAFDNWEHYLTFSQWVRMISALDVVILFVMCAIFFYIRFTDHIIIILCCITIFSFPPLF
jgi:hypothetical protein